MERQSPQTLLIRIADHRINFFGRAAACFRAGWVASFVIGFSFLTLLGTSARAYEPLQTLSETSSSSTALLESIGRDLPSALAISRPVLLGSRDPLEQSCVTVVTKGQLHTLGFDNYSDPDGGPGSRITTLCQNSQSRMQSPLLGFKWFQGRFRIYLQNQLVLNRTAIELMSAVETQTGHLHEQTLSWTVLPDDLKSIEVGVGTDWASTCLTSLNRAIQDRDLAKTKLWAGELAAAAFALADLHRWFDFLLENHLQALEFQKRCENLFELANKWGQPFEAIRLFSIFPAGTLTSSMSNYYEVERQAEQLFTVPAERMQKVASQATLSEQLVWILPELRKPYVVWQSALGESNQETLALAARSPFHRSYLMNMLFRYSRANTLERMSGVLKKFDSVSPHASVNELMDVLMYRAQFSAGLEWDDRFQPELTKAGMEIDSTKSASEAFVDAVRWTNRFYKPEQYHATFTLREAIMQRRLDCVRATDMIGTIFRNAGRSRFGHIRWCSEIEGHAVAAYLGVESEQSRTLVLDGLDPADEPEIWPDAYFNGHKWPPVLANNPMPYAVELFGRGLDSYVWLEGYIVRGPNAGQLTTATNPYLEGRKLHQTRVVYAGPYPD